MGVITTAKGIIYCMTTIVPGLIKIGKTGPDNFEKRMYSLEKNGYAQVVGLKRRFAIKVDDYDSKEKLLHEIFSKSRIAETELFALDSDLVVQLLSSLEGDQIYPKYTSKEDVYETATEEREINSVSSNMALIPNGTYYLNETVKGHGTVKATMKVSNGRFIVQKGSECLPCKKDWMPEPRQKAIIENGILQKNVECNSPSTAGWIPMGKANNGWKIWKTKSREPIDIFRK